MKSDNASSNPPAPAKGVLSWLLPSILIISALGMVTTGTLLWQQSRPNNSQTVTPTTASQPVATENVPTAPMSEAAPSAKGSTPHEPPVALTAGMTPPQAALTLGNWYYDHEAWPQAVENYRRAISQGMDNPDVRTDYGSSLRFSGQPQKALEQYKLAQKQNPRHENSLFNQGGLFASDLKQPAKGIAVWREYLKRFPNGKSVAAARQLIAKTQK